MIATLELRLLMCPRCGAPLEVPGGGGYTQCKYCGSASTIGPRPFEAKALPGARAAAHPDEPARLAGLRRQAESRENNRYSLDHQPAAFQDVDGFDASEATATRLLDGLRTAVALFREKPDPALEHRVFWLAMRVTNLFAMSRQRGKAGPALQTAGEVVTDRGFREMILHELASQAMVTGQLDEGEAWLAQCDPAPEILEVDTSYRTTRAELCVRRGSHAEALVFLGERAGAIPIHSGTIASAGMMRASALERLGRCGEAEVELTGLVAATTESLTNNNLELVDKVTSLADVRARCRENALAFAANSITKGSGLNQACAEVWDRLAARGELPERTQMAAAFGERFVQQRGGRSGGDGCTWLFLAVAVVAVLAYVLLR